MFGLGISFNTLMNMGTALMGMNMQRKTLNAMEDANASIDGGKKSDIAASVQENKISDNSENYLNLAGPKPKKLQQDEQSSGLGFSL